MPPLTSEIKEWVIYKITNPNGRIYIGKSYNFRGRLNNYRYLAGRTNTQKLLFNSLKKYGFYNHSIEVIDSFSANSEYASGKEIFWIRSFMCNDIKWRNGIGMNMTDGGEGINKPLWTKESREKLSASRKGWKMSEEQKAFLSSYFKKNPSRSMLGIKMSQSSKDKMSIAKKGLPSPKKGKYGKPILIYDLNDKFISEATSLLVAKEITNVPKSNISKILHGTRHTYNGFKFKYK